MPVSAASEARAGSGVVDVVGRTRRPCRRRGADLRQGAWRRDGLPGDVVHPSRRVVQPHRARSDLQARPAPRRDRRGRVGQHEEPLRGGGGRPPPGQRCRVGGVVRRRRAPHPDRTAAVRRGTVAQTAHDQSSGRRVRTASAGVRWVPRAPRTTPRATGSARARGPTTAREPPGSHGWSRTCGRPVGRRPGRSPRRARRGPRTDASPPRRWRCRHRATALLPRTTSGTASPASSRRGCRRATARATEPTSGASQVAGRADAPGLVRGRAPVPAGRGAPRSTRVVAPSRSGWSGRHRRRRTLLPTRTRTRSPRRRTWTRGSVGSCTARCGSGTSTTPAACTVSVPSAGTAREPAAVRAGDDGDVPVGADGELGVRRGSPARRAGRIPRPGAAGRRRGARRAPTSATAARTPALAHPAYPLTRASAGRRADRAVPTSTSTSVGTSPWPRDGSGWSRVRRTPRPCRRAGDGTGPPPGCRGTGRSVHRSAGRLGVSRRRAPPRATCGRQPDRAAPRRADPAASATTNRSARSLHGTTRMTSPISPKVITAPAHPYRSPSAGPEDRPDAGDEHPLDREHQPQLPAGEPDRPQGRGLPATLEDRERQRVGHADQGDHHGDAEQPDDDREERVDQAFVAGALGARRCSPPPGCRAVPPGRPGARGPRRRPGPDRPRASRRARPGRAARGWPG